MRLLSSLQILEGLPPEGSSRPPVWWRTPRTEVLHQSYNTLTSRAGPRAVCCLRRRSCSGRCRRQRQPLPVFGRAAPPPRGRQPRTGPQGPPAARRGRWRWCRGARALRARRARLRLASRRGGDARGHCGSRRPSLEGTARSRGWTRPIAGGRGRACGPARSGPVRSASPRLRLGAGSAGGCPLGRQGRGGMPGRAGAAAAEAAGLPDFSFHTLRLVASELLPYPIFAAVHVGPLVILSILAFIFCGRGGKCTKKCLSLRKRQVPPATKELPGADALRGREQPGGGTTQQTALSRPSDHGKPKDSSSRRQPPRTSGRAPRPSGAVPGALLPALRAGSGGGGGGCAALPVPAALRVHALPLSPRFPGRCGARGVAAPCARSRRSLDPQA
ncbi:uncharacterized protein LOC115335284 [Aquila chrysaetos chrysaetos]|uniref:uncharacterized protein LOC115335284 n=1 Tax=Aquila chrysaetos chrysaetos TaxID=223781 RepID=UPI001B7D2C7E|nr:uncharacterized protein LOC115335284 [Aquila chrysaetos chrysaetos]